MKALILGGTAFLGIALRETLKARGHEVTLFNRGKTASAPAGARTIHGDRTLGLEALGAERFDAILDTSGYLPHVVERSARFFAGRTDRYVFVSSISVFDTSPEEIDEHSFMPPLPEGASRTSMTWETYGPLKAMCERIVIGTFRQRATVLRPGLIVGPHDPTDRFTYWPVRFARGGDVLAPGTPERPIQIVDVRDLAEFIVHLCERGRGGDYNVVTPPGALAMGDVTTACANAARVPSRVVWVDDDFLLERKVEPWMGLPLWIPPQLNEPGFYNVNVRKALVAGLRTRPLARTAHDTLAWALTRPKDRTPRAGITADRERELLSEYAANA